MFRRIKAALKWRITGYIRDILRKELDNNDARNIRRYLQREALEETVAFVKEHMQDVPSAPDREGVWTHVIPQASTEGLFLEFGVASGWSINEIAARVSKTVYGFDSFEGLPAPWWGAQKGHFCREDLPSVRHNVVLVPGMFDETLPRFLEEHLEPCAFVHVDCVLYSSTKTVLELLRGRLVKGTVICFDEYFNYPGWRNTGEYKAFTEFAEEHGLSFEYLSYCFASTPVSVRLL